MLSNHLRLYLVTDEGPDLVRRVEKAIRGGVTCVQLRRKKISDEQFFSEAIVLRELCQRYQIPFIVNDRVEIAKKVDTDWLHIGQDDEGILKARNIVGNSMKIGVSVHSVEEALEAEKAGADYLGVGTLFPTHSKNDASLLTLETLLDIRSKSSIPIVLIGGINEQTIPIIPEGATDGFAVISAILSHSDPQEAARKLRNLSDQYVLRDKT